MKNLLLLFIFIFSFSIFQAVATDTGQINGTVTDSITGEPLVGASVAVMLNGKDFGAIADIDGYYVLKPLPPGIYDVRVRYVNYSEMTIKGVKVSPNLITGLNVKLSTGSLPEVRVFPHPLIGIDPIIPVFDGGKPIAVRSADDMIATVAGVYQSDAGGELYFRGSRPEASDYYIDNVKIIGDHNVPAGAIAEIMLYTGGIPARYGDVTGGVVVITTKSYNMYQVFE